MFPFKLLIRIRSDSSHFRKETALQRPLVSWRSTAVVSSISAAKVGLRIVLFSQSLCRLERSRPETAKTTFKPNHVKTLHMVICAIKIGQGVLTSVTAMGVA